MKDLFRTGVEPKEMNLKLSHEDKVFVMGSCFAHEIGEKLKRYKFEVCLNPFGILFNPEAMAMGLDRLLEGKMFNEDDLHFHGDLFHSFLHHGRFSGKNKLEVLDKINHEFVIGIDAIQNARFLFLTFGTAWTYISKSSQGVVANCHRFPQDYFEKVLWEHDAITSRWISLLKKVNELNPGLQVVISVSPVRYLKDGFQENQVSKSHLQLAVWEIVHTLPNVHYFPAFEIMMDDLRDYRFYNEDLIHPSSMAIDYIWQHFGRTAIDNTTLSRIEELERHVKLLEHRSIHETEAQKKEREDRAQRAIEMIISTVKGTRKA